MDERTIERVVIYGRVSTPGQVEKGLTYEEYFERLRDYCRARDWKVVREFGDPGKTGRTVKNRPQYQEMMRLLRKRDDIDAVVVYKMDRVHRSQRNFLRMMEQLKEWGKGFVSLGESFDTSNSMGRFVQDMIARIAQLESEQTGERVIVGHDAARKQGIHFGHVIDPWWEVDRKSKKAQELMEQKYKGLIVPSKKLLWLGEMRDNGKAWEQIRIEMGWSNEQTLRRNYSKLLKWRNDPLDGFVQSKTTGVVAPTKSWQRRSETLRRRMVTLVNKDQQHLYETEEPLFSTIQKMAKEAGISSSTAYRWEHEGHYDLSYRKSGEDGNES